ncbi:unannotated protein [freshwater metagenome]|uniref:Unannotated protein n=2 Tax=freshwater metagenome TaxID=449393 RepID=A0A6J6YCD6_9ZZZZ|nr:hypothetical protein [Actinomycetota bacterium]MSW16401.1 hypothetical protein [Actinomycetota bacterium]MSX85441.1 hypothetical protein [Actinomycetota bacterium]
MKPVAKQLIGALAITLLSQLVISPQSISAADVPPRKILSGWVPYYSVKNSIASVVVNQDLIREVSPFWYTLKSEKVILDLYAAAKLTDPMSVSLNTLRNLNIGIIPTITDGTDKLVLSNLLGNAQSRTNIVATIANLVKVNNFDGIDLDFENFAFIDGNMTWNATRPRWVAFVKELSASLHADKKVLSITAPVDFDPVTKRKGYTVYDWKNIAPYIDRLRIMTYDYSTSTVGPIGPLIWVEDAVKYATSVIPASKIFLGVPGYGRDWVVKVVGTCAPADAKVINTKIKAATFVMRDAISLATGYGATPQYMEKEGEVTFTYTKTFPGFLADGTPTSCTATRTAWYQDSKSYVARANLVAKYRLGGIMAWTLGMEDAATMPSVRSYAQTIAPDQVVVTLVTDKSETEFGQPISVKTLFTLPDNQPIANLPLNIEARNSDGTWRKIYSGVTAIDGTLGISTLLAGNTALHAVSESSWERLAGYSKDININFARKIVVTAPTSAVHGREIVISGFIQPKESGVKLTLERLIGSGYKEVTMKNSIISDLDGRFTLTHVEIDDGFATFRVTSTATGNSALGYSNNFIISIR